MVLEKRLGRSKRAKLRKAQRADEEADILANQPRVLARLQVIADRIMADTGDQGLIVEDAISICAFVSKRYGTELTIVEGAVIRKLLDKREREAEFAAQAHPRTRDGK